MGHFFSFLHLPGRRTLAVITKLDRSLIVAYYSGKIGAESLEGQAFPLFLVLFCHIMLPFWASVSHL